MLCVWFHIDILSSIWWYIHPCHVPLVLLFLAPAAHVPTSLRLPLASCHMYKYTEIKIILWHIGQKVNFLGFKTTQHLVPSPGRVESFPWPHGHWRSLSLFLTPPQTQHTCLGPLSPCCCCVLQVPPHCLLQAPVHGALPWGLQACSSLPNLDIVAHKRAPWVAGPGRHYRSYGGCSCIYRGARKHLLFLRFLMCCYIL